MVTLEQIYGNIKNLEPFTHPEYDKKFKFLTNKKIKRLAEKISEKIMSSGYDTVVVSETGASPFTFICQKLLEKQGKKINWLYVKFPRESTKNIYPVLKYYLGKESDVLKQFCEKINLPAEKPILDRVLRNKPEQTKEQEAISKIFEGTEIANTLSKPFLYFDEYIDSGTTLRNAQFYFNFFTKNPHFKIISYMIFAGDDKKYEDIYFTLFNKNTRLDCYNLGVYPFENRIDLIGYFYCLTNKEFRKISLEELKGKENNISSFLNKVYYLAQKKDLLNKVRKNSKIPAVAKFLTINNIVQYYLFSLEKDEIYSEFLWQLFDMYGPIWSPMPDEYHLDFWNAFKKTSEEFTPELSDEYKIYSSSIIENLKNIYIKRRKKWLKEIMEVIKND